MKHLGKIFVCLSIVLSLLLTSVYAFDTANQQFPQDITKAERNYLEELGTLQKHAVDAYDILYNSFLVAGSDVEHYPENFGGAYIDGEKLHILIVDLPNQETTYYVDFLDTYLNYIVFENADYSLQSLYDGAKNVAHSLMDTGIPVASYGTNVKENSAYIGIDINELGGSGSRKTIATIQENNYSIPITFFDEQRTSMASELICGSAVSGYTIGVCGTYQGANAIGLCGHNLHNGSLIKNQSQTEIIGSVNVQQWESGGSGDYAIAKITNKNYTTSGLVGNPSASEGQWYVTGASNRPANNASIIKYGKNGGYAYGTVVDNNCTAVFDFGTSYPNVELSGMVKVKVSNGSVVVGDSGGPIFSSYGVIYGTVTSQINSNGDFFFSPYLYLNNKGFVIKTYE